MAATESPYTPPGTAIGLRRIGVRRGVPIDRDDLRDAGAPFEFGDPPDDNALLAAASASASSLVARDAAWSACAAAAFIGSCSGPTVAGSGGVARSASALS